jgi:hypothetical protein
MALIDFPASPSLNDEYTFEGRTWLWNGTGWEVKSFIALMGDAKAGRPNEAAIQQVMGAILQVGTFTEQHLGELQAALVTGHLDGTYVLSPS